jgi:hypothetical protein
MHLVTINPLTGQVNERPPATLVATSEREFEIADGELQGSSVVFIAGADDGHACYVRVLERAVPRAD